MDPDRLTLGRLDTRCTAWAGPEAAAAIGARIDRSLREDLPAALARAAAGVLSGQGGVLRIRRIGLRIDLGEGFDRPGLAGLFAERIAAALKAALAGGAPEVRHWPDHDSYLAAYVLMRGGVIAEADWAFPDLTALEHLPAERAAAELIRARPGILPALARAAAAQGDAATPVMGWPDGAQAALVRALLASPLAPAEAGDLARAFGQIPSVLGPPVPARTAAQDLGAALRMTLRLLAGGAVGLQPRAVVLAAVAALAVRRAGDPPAATGAASDRPDLPPGPDRDLLDQARATVAAHPHGRVLLDRLRPVAAPPPLSAPPALRSRPPTAAPTGSPTESEALASVRMGLGLLMPSVLLLDAARHLEPTALAQAVWQALDPQDWPETARDPALQVLWPVDPKRVDLSLPQPAPPERLLAVLAPGARPVFDAADPNLRWSALLLGDFASRLRGLQASSHGYLRRQFLHRPGTVRRDPDRITLRLAPLPLGIVLRMAGLDGPQGRLPQPGQPRLVLDLGEAP